MYFLTKKPFICLKTFYTKLTLKNCTDARRSKASSEAYFFSMLSVEAAATTPQMGIFQRQQITM